ncbi:mucin-5AC-like [Anopheles nili]|uniref:mucin-5AC-like n=1 Tax=Anopheles nili TaxID=185578 RepID=UPI00237A87BD|nr:mucin-5AC-like [Anopheles nili]
MMPNGTLPMGRWLLIVFVAACWHHPWVASYNVAEHRLDYIKLGEGREFNYHYNDGASSGYDKRKFNKYLQGSSKPPYTVKNFPSPVEQIATNEFQTQPQRTYVKQESLLPVYESHEKSVRYVPVDFSPLKPTYSLTQPTGSASYGGNFAERVIQMIHLRHPPRANQTTVGTVAGSSSGSGSSENGITSTVHFQTPAFQYHQHPGGYQYFNAHPVPSAYELVRPISHFPPPRPYLAPALTTTKAPYLAPFLLKTSTTTTTTTTTPAPVEAPTRRPTARPPYVAPGVTHGRPTTSPRPVPSGGSGGSNTQQPYEPEFDIDIRIDLRDDSA